MAELGATQFLAMGSRPALVPHTRPAFVGLADADPAFESLFGMESSPTGYQGPTGIQTVLGMHLRGLGMKTARLTVRIPSYVTAGPNPKAALALVERIDAATGRRTGLGSLRGSVTAYEQQTEAALDQLENSRQMRGQITEMERVYDESEAAQPQGRDQGSAELPSSDALIGDIEALLREQRRGPEGSVS